MINNIDKLETEYYRLYNLVHTMTFALQNCIDNNKQTDFLITLQEIIDQKSERIFEEIDSLTIRIYNELIIK